MSTQHFCQYIKERNKNRSNHRHGFKLDKLLTKLDITKEKYTKWKETKSYYNYNGGCVEKYEKWERTTTSIKHLDLKSLPIGVREVSLIYSRNYTGSKLIESKLRSVDPPYHSGSESWEDTDRVIAILTDDNKIFISDKEMCSSHYHTGFLSSKVVSIKADGDIYTAVREKEYPLTRSEKIFKLRQIIE